MFAGDADGRFAEGRRLTDADGADLNVGRATVVFVVDWEGDGDQDLLVGDIEGKVQIVRNDSGDKTFKAGRVEELTAGHAAIRAPGRNSGPVVADWDGDGKPDLIVGCGDGSVELFRNTAAEGEPVLAAAEVLIGASSGYPRKPPGTSPQGMRAKLAVTDWNSDGKLDLLVGDYSSGVGEQPALSEEQAAKKAELEARRDELTTRRSAMAARFQPLYDEWYRRAFEELGLDTATPWRVAIGKLDAETRSKVTALLQTYQQEDPTWPEYSKLNQEYSEVNQELRAFQAPRSSHGFVWLYLRR